MADDDDNISNEFSNDDDMTISEESDEFKSSLSALQENISKKGKNSYYYAHKKKIDGPQWDGKEEPRKLTEEIIPLNSLSNVSSTQVNRLNEYSWADGDKNVKIYVDFKDADKIDDANITLNFTSTSFDFRFKCDDQENVLSIVSLYEDIDNAVFAKKPTKFVVTLTKSIASSWISLKKT